MRNQFILGLTLFVAACVSAPAPQQAPPKQVIPAVPPSPPPVAVSVPSGDWTDWPRSPGDWGYRADARGSVALFGMTGQEASFLIRCDRQKARVYLSRSGAFPAGESGRMTIRATSGLQTYPVSNASAAPPFISAELMPNDPHLDAMAYSRGKFLVSVKGATDLVIPSWSEFARVVEDCR